MNRYRVLVAEDEEVIRKYLVRELSAEGLVVDEASDGVEALEQFCKHLQPVILLDLRLPELDGIEVLRRVKELRPDTQVVILTGHGGRRDAITSLNLHAYRFIEKPPDISLIIDSVNEAHETYQDAMGLEDEELPDQDVPSLEDVREAMAAIPADRLKKELDTE